METRILYIFIELKDTKQNLIQAVAMIDAKESRIFFPKGTFVWDLKREMYF